MSLNNEEIVHVIICVSCDNVIYPKEAWRDESDAHDRCDELCEQEIDNFYVMPVVLKGFKQIETEL